MSSWNGGPRVQGFIPRLATGTFLPPTTWQLPASTTFLSLMGLTLLTPVYSLLRLPNA